MFLFITNNLEQKRTNFHVDSLNKIYSLLSLSVFSKYKCLADRRRGVVGEVKLYDMDHNEGNAFHSHDINQLAQSQQLADLTITIKKRNQDKQDQNLNSPIQPIRPSSHGCVKGPRLRQRFQISLPGGH